ncbi:hypothetical protein AVEN_156621-1 [Araneus ventricosus]|uniref:Uncharacterized protein n=1 Tax=Araneus ventricosus TaxID=182803 RepID=A0A4Y2NXN6_ARAVE|nr:hypothetical protein AVEN_156621-1 [Araneus ventricosus]
MVTDDSTFTREGMLNSHNFHVWSEENPHATRTHSAPERFSVNVLPSIVGDHLVGPYLLPERRTGANYLIFLSTTDVRLHLNAKYGQQWIGWGGPVLWPARSPDLICLDYFLWGYVKSLVYENPVNSAEDLVVRIAAAAGEVRDTPGIFANVRSSMRRRCEACITARGRNFEHLL